MSPVFARNPQYEFGLMRVMGQTPYGAAEIGECLAAASRILEGDDDRWYDEWTATAEWVLAQGEQALAGGHRVSARDAFLRAANYFRTSECSSCTATRPTPVSAARRPAESARSGRRPRSSNRLPRSSRSRTRASRCPATSSPAATSRGPRSSHTTGSTARGRSSGRWSGRQASSADTTSSRAAVCLWTSAPDGAGDPMS